ncbi:hypothetical protein DFJ73DRAFT_765470 [Zopfochytrium polystomum]|nr:hypothetical protein DFJ73DRAFT_765470 [Zopfochytrium polystomum]
MSIAPSHKCLAGTNQTTEGFGICNDICKGGPAALCHVHGVPARRVKLAAWRHGVPVRQPGRGAAGRVPAGVGHGVREPGVDRRRRRQLHRRRHGVDRVGLCGRRIHITRCLAPTTAVSYDPTCANEYVQLNAGCQPGPLKAFACTSNFTKSNAIRTAGYAVSNCKSTAPFSSSATATAATTESYKMSAWIVLNAVLALGLSLVAGAGVLS